MKNFLLTIAMLASQTALAHEFKTKDFCSDKTKDICGHIGYNKKPDTKVPFEFTADIINKKKAKDITDMVIEVVSKDSKAADELITTAWTIRPDGHHWDAKASSIMNNEIYGVRLSYKYKKSDERILIELIE